MKTKEWQISGVLFWIGYALIIAVLLVLLGGCGNTKAITRPPLKSFALKEPTMTKGHYQFTQPKEWGSRSWKKR